MRYILTITLALLVSINVSAEEMTDQDYLNEAKTWADFVLTSKLYLDNGKYGYHLYAKEGPWIKGAFEAKSSELCGTKGYKKVLDEKLGINRRQVIQCNE